MGTQRSKVRQALLAIVVVVALGAASSPFWLFSSAEQDRLAPELTEKLADILSLSEDEETPTADLTKSTSATALADAAAGAAPKKASASAGSEIKAPLSTLGTRSAPPEVATTTTTTTDTPEPRPDTKILPTPESKPLRLLSVASFLAADALRDIPPTIGANALIAYFGVSPNPPTAKERQTLQELGIDSISGASAIAVKDNLLPKEILAFAGGDPYEVYDKRPPQQRIAAIYYLACVLSAESGGALYNIITTIHYPRTLKALYEVTLQEYTEHKLPELTDDEPLDLGAYETIYLSFPVWWGDMPMAVYSFLEKYDLSGKNIIVVYMHSGGEHNLNGNLLRKIASLEPNATVYHEPLAVHSNKFKDVQQLQESVRQYIAELSEEFD